MEQQSAALRAMNDAVLAIAAEATIEPMLQRLAQSARELVDARYAAIGVPDGEGAFAQFITSGMSDELIAAMGPLPRTHGLLGAMLSSPVPYRTSDVRRDPRFRGWWPSAHPEMRSFLGVPIVASSGIVGALYLTDKVGAEDFDESDQQLIEMLSVHAALAIEKANLYERSRELSIVEERNRLARELHDSVTQKLFGLTLTAEAAATVIDRDPEAGQGAAAPPAGAHARGDGRAALADLRAAPAGGRERGPGDGAAQARRRAAERARRRGRAERRRRRRAARRARARSCASPRRRCRTPCATPAPAASTSGCAPDDGHLSVAVADDGVGFDPDEPGLRSRRLGLTSMEERARALGGTLSIESRPGAGTTIVLEVPR